MVQNGQRVPESGRTRVVPVRAGLYVLRYVSTRAGATPPLVHVASREPAPRCELILSDSRSAPELGAPGEGLVVRAEAQTDLILTVIPAFRGGSVDAELALEPVSRAASARAATPTGVEKRMADDAAPSVGVLVHAAFRGDLRAQGGAWLCGPDAPALIEGLAVTWANKPRDVELMIGCAVGQGGAQVHAPQASGSFTGSRGQRMPIKSLGLALEGPGATRFEIICEALFLSAPPIVQRGRAIALSGPRGDEPLIGLKIDIVRASHSAAPGTLSSTASEPLDQSGGLGRWDKVGRVRVFRSTRQQELEPKRASA